MVETYGLTHISLAVADPQRSLEFYARAFGVREYYRDEEQLQVQGPGPKDVLTAGGKLLRRGEFSPGFPFEIWFE